VRSEAEQMVLMKKSDMLGTEEVQDIVIGILNQVLNIGWWVLDNLQCDCLAWCVFLVAAQSTQKKDIRINQNQSKGL